ncbi:hypothetical protein [Acinetobacter tianfuensis]|uniref:Uncharacterized protein n=1 Tax=Acinetobacter tianfuensis TaxID=2419603 RepID=A0A3A8EI19_9GAMM|nr:hypothetical protein [Acinetobacter tianfuensis]RKG29634.1 hypothetical protein D7V32_14165 [Acinetobacter tianfuensis]
MKKHTLIISFALIAGLSQFSSANDQISSLKKSCLKDYPAAIGETDQELLQLYSQLCDKSNKKNTVLQQEISTAIAARYQAIGKNLKSLQVIEDLKLHNINTSELTDISFLAGIGIAQQSADQMRTAELRSLSEKTYAPAKKLSETIQFAQPTIEKTTAQDNTEKSASKAKTKKSKQSVKTKSSEKSSAASVKTHKAPAKPAPAAKKESVQTKPSSASGFSPFSALK